MPIATGNENVEGERFELESLKGGFVVLRRLTYGQKMFRRSLLSKARMETGAAGNRADRRAQAKQSFTAELELMNEKVTLFEFQNCIVEHNLEYLDAAGEIKLLDFHRPEDVKKLDGRVGEEIDELITDYNNFEADDETGK